MSTVTPAYDSNLTNYYKQVVSEFEDQMRENNRKTRENAQKQSEALEESYRRDLLKREEESQNTIRNIGESSEESLRQEREKHLSEVDRLKNQLYNKQGQMMMPIEEHKKQVQDLVEAQARRQEIDDLMLQDARDEFQAKVNENTRKSNAQIRTMVDQQTEETRGLEERIKDLGQYNQKLDKDRSDTLTRANLEHNNALRAETRRLSDTYGNDLQKLQETIRSKDDYYSRINAESSSEKAAQNAALIKQQNEEHHQEVSDLQNTFKTQMDRLEKQRKQGEEKAEENLHNSLGEAYRQRDQALENQAKEYGSTMSRQRLADDEKIQALEKSLQNQKTSEDTTLISPAAENAIRSAVIRDYEKTLGLEVEKNKVQQAETQRKYAQNYSQSLQEFEDRNRESIQQNNKERSIERTQYMNSLSDAEYSTNAKLREQESAHDREKENLNKQFGFLMERQRREYEQILSSVRSEAEEKLVTLKLESDGNASLMQRDFNTRQNELIREYEKKLSDQKREFDYQMEDLKTQSQVAQRETERRSRQELESQTRGFEQRMAQNEAQSKERERSIAQSYEDELDRTRRSYELLSKKKS